MKLVRMRFPQFSFDCIRFDGNVPRLQAWAGADNVRFLGANVIGVKTEAGVFQLRKGDFVCRGSVGLFVVSKAVADDFYCVLPDRVK